MSVSDPTAADRDFARAAAILADQPDDKLWEFVDGYVRQTLDAATDLPGVRRRAAERAAAMLAAYAERAA